MRAPLLFCFFCLCGSLVAQSYESRIHFRVNVGDTSQLHQLILLDYTKLLGTALEIGGDTILFQVRSADEPSAIPLREMRFLGVFDLDRVRSRTYNGREYKAYPGFTDLTYERTALPFHSRGRVKVVNLLYAVVEWNLGKNVQIGTGLAGPVGFLATARLRHSFSEDFHVGVSGQTLFPPFAQFGGDLIMVGDLTTMFTFGNDQRFLNLGSGILFNTDDFERNVVAHRMGLGGALSPRVHLYGEALLALGRGRFRELTLLPSVNVSIGARRHRWRFGVFTVFLDEDSFFPPPLPYVGYSYYW